MPSNVSPGATLTVDALEGAKADASTATVTAGPIISSRPILRDRSDISKITATMSERVQPHYKRRLSTCAMYHYPLDRAVMRPTPSGECGEHNRVSTVRPDSGPLNEPQRGLTRFLVTFPIPRRCGTRTQEPQPCESVLGGFRHLRIPRTTQLRGI